MDSAPLQPSRGSTRDIDFTADDAFDQPATPAGLIQSDVDLREFRAALYRNRWLIGGIAGLGIIIGLMLALLTTPIYRATSTIQIDQAGPQILDEDAQDPTGQALDSDSYLQTQVEVIKSRSLADRVARALNYYRGPTLFDAMGEDPPESEPGSEGWQRAVIARLQDSLTVELMNDTRLVSISFDSPSNDHAQTVANRFADEFIASTLQRRFETSAYSRKFLEGQLDQTRSQLEASERALIDYAREQGITNVASGAEGEEARDSLTGSNLSALNAAYAKAQSDRILAQQRWEQASRTATMSLPEVLSNSSVQSLISQRAQLQAQLQGERDRHSAEYPTVQQMEAQLASLDQQISAQAARVRSSIREAYNVAREQEESLRGNVQALQQTALGEQSRGVQLGILQREADTNRALYDALLQRYRELNAAAGITANNISIIDRATAPSSPIWPRPFLFALLGGIFGLAIAALAAFARERLDDSIRHPDDVQRKLGLPLLGLTPRAEAGELEDELRDPHSALSESIYALHTALELSTRHGVPRTLLVTSTRPAEGKSSTSYALARDFAQAGTKVLLVDADLRRPSVHHTFGLENVRGFSNLLANHGAVETLLQPGDIENLSIMTSGPIPPSPPRLLAQDALERSFAELGEKFELVILDAPPVLGLADAVQLASAAEASLFVIESQGGSQGQTKAAIRRLAEGGANIVGAVLTKFDSHKIGYGEYGYGDYYHYGKSRETAEA